MKKTALALSVLAFVLVTLPASGAGDPVGMTDAGSPDFQAIERLLNDNGQDARRRLMEAIQAMDAYAKKASPSANELVIMGRAYLRAMGNGGNWQASNLATKALK